MELIHAARTIVASKKVGGGCNCLSGQAVIVSKGWAQRRQFEAALVAELERQPTYPAYYPGAKERCKTMLEKYIRLGRVIPTKPPAFAQPTRPGNYSDDDHPVLVYLGTYVNGQTA
jgi:hypothetical protein